MDPPSRSPLAAGLPAVLLQPGDDGRSSTGLAELHLDLPAPVSGPAAGGLSASLPVRPLHLVSSCHVSSGVFNQMTLSARFQIHSRVASLANFTEEEGCFGGLP